MSKTATTWELMKASWHVLMRDKALLLFPVVSGIACFLVLLTFIVLEGKGFRHDTYHSVYGTHPTLPYNQARNID